MILALKLFPGLLARNSIAAREVLVQAITRYYRANHHNQGSFLVKSRFEHSTVQHKISDIADVARFELGGAFAILSNTIPAAFWVIFHIYANPEVLDDCRREVSLVVKDQDGVRTIDLHDVQTSCPVLLSTFQEVLRFRFTGVSTRVVMEDHLLDGRYFLKKGSALMIPGSVQHLDPSVWGPDANEFNHKRFVRKPGVKGTNSAAFRAFGGGHVLCPGRHFATYEVLAFTAMMILRFDIRPSKRIWLAPKTDKSPMSSSIPIPDTDIDVEISQRTEAEWDMFMSGPSKAFGITARDTTIGEL